MNWQTLSIFLGILVSLAGTVLVFVNGRRQTSLTETAQLWKRIDDMDTRIKVLEDYARELRTALEQTPGAHVPPWPDELTTRRSA